ALDRTLGVRRNFKLERRAGVIVKDLDRIDLVPVRAFAAREKEIDGGRCRAPSVDRARIAKRLAIMSAFRMGREVKQAHHLGGGKHDGSFVGRWSVPGTPASCGMPSIANERKSLSYDLFLRSRISANTFQA